VLIRPATGADAASIVDVIQTVYAEYDFVFEAREETPDLLAFDQTYDGRAGAFFVAELAGAVVGSIGVRLGPTGLAEIVRLYLAASLRGQGVGRRLVDAAVAWARANGARVVELWSDTRFTDAHRLYTRYGFVQGDQHQLTDVNNSREYYFRHTLEQHR
jgi:putative acetyltransferase